MKLYTYIFTIYCTLLSSICSGQNEVISNDSLRIIIAEPDVSTEQYKDTSNQKVGRKIVYWIHGLAGGVESWQRVNDYTSYQLIPDTSYPVRDFFGVNEVYSDLQNSDLINVSSDFANRLKTTVDQSQWSNINRSTHAIAIAHSQGGIIARGIRYANHSNNSNINVPEQFGSLITIGTPHGGSQLINSSHPNNGDAQKWINQGCKAIAKAEIQGFLNNTPFINLFISQQTLNDFSNEACGSLGEIVLPILIKSIRKPISADYAKDAHTLNVLDSLAVIDSTLNTLVVFSVENDPVFWRVLETMTYNKDSSLSGSALFNDPFSLNNDSNLPQIINHYISSYNAKYQLWRRRAANPFYFILRLKNPRKLYNKALVYRNAANWLQTANTSWKRLIGARRDSTYIDGYQCDCITFDHNGLSITSNVVTDPSDCTQTNNSTCKIFPRTLNEIVEENSDGVVPVSSQIKYPSNSRYQKMLLTNHMQQRNSSETRRILNDAFNGEFGTDFKLDKK